MRLSNLVGIAVVAACGFGEAYAQSPSLEELCKGTVIDHETPCREFEFGKADADLNTAYAAMIKYMQGLDRDFGVNDYEKSLREAQRTWVANRDPSCTMEALGFRGGSGVGPAWWTCRTRLTRERMETLKHWERLIGGS